MVTSDSGLYIEFQVYYSEMIAIQASTHAGMVDSGEHVLIRRPAIPRLWDPISRPHVAVVVEDSNGLNVRYYLSRVLNQDNGRYTLEVTDIDSLPDGTLVEVRFNARMANLFRLQRTIDGTIRWKWIARCRGLQGFDYPSSIDWDSFLPSGGAAQASYISA